MRRVRFLRPFPGNAPGKIIVDYHSDGMAWSLSVKDNGVGIPAGTRKAEAGLGTGIIEALTKNLGATMQVFASNPGLAITIFHKLNPSVSPDAA